jgi:hypothetical protein
MGTELTITWLKNRNAPIEKSTPPSRKLKKSLIGSLEAMPSLPPGPWWQDTWSLIAKDSPW